MLQAGVKAPDFTLKDKDGNEVTLSSFQGKKVVLYFYPKDNSPGCTKQACAFVGAYIGFKQRNVEVIGVSKDSEKSHSNFAAKYELPFILVSDPELTAIQAYDVWKEKKLYGKVSMGVVRSTYVIDEKGVIEKVFEKAKPDTNAQEILEYLDLEMCIRDSSSTIQNYDVGMLPFNTRGHLMLEEKKRIAERAAEFINDGDYIFVEIGRAHV